MVVHPDGGVKEQAAGLYAQKLAAEGFVTLAFDASHQGASGGLPSVVEQATETVPPSVPEPAKVLEAKSDKPIKVKKKDGKIFPTKLEATGNPRPKSVDQAFSGRIEKINLKEIASGRLQAAFSVAIKWGESRPYVIEVSETAVGMAMFNLLLTTFAAERKVRITTAFESDGSLRIVAMEVRK